MIYETGRFEFAHLLIWVSPIVHQDIITSWFEVTPIHHVVTCLGGARGYLSEITQQDYSGSECTGLEFH